MDEERKKIMTIIRNKSLSIGWELIMNTVFP